LISGGRKQRLRFTLRFSLEQMHQNLRDLQRCVAVWSEQSEVPKDETEGDKASRASAGVSGIIP
jgi:hypothetical protein